MYQPEPGVLEEHQPGGHGCACAGLVTPALIVLVLGMCTWLALVRSWPGLEILAARLGGG